MSKLVELCREIEKVCPVHGAAHNKDGGIRIDFKDDATQEQRIAARKIASCFDLCDDAPIDVRGTIKDLAKRVAALESR